MKVDTMLAVPPAKVAAAAADAERSGLDGVWLPEVKHDAFIGVALASRTTERIALATGIAVAFGRTPMTVAQQANDLQAVTEGRLVLGLGSQIKAHITRRYDMPWSRPAARMREFVLAMRAIWTAWSEGGKLDFQGEIYSNTLMSPMFVPEPHGFGAPTVIIAGVGPLMTEVAGEVADGLLAHSFTTREYLENVTVPALARGTARAADAGRSTTLVGAPFIALGNDEPERAAAVAKLRHQVAFYASTPAYRPVLEQHGWEALGDRLHALSRSREWEQMAGLVDDTMLDAFVISGTPVEAAARIQTRYGTLFDRISPVTTDTTDPKLVGELAAAVRELTSSVEPV